MYEVILNNKYSGLTFRFNDIEEAMYFIGVACEKGEYKNACGEIEPIQAIITFKEV